MSINELPFLGFLLLCVLAYYGLPRRFRWLVLLAASVCFYASYGLRAIPYLGVTTLGTYGFGLWLDRVSGACPADLDRAARKAWKQRNTRRKRLVLAAALALDFAALVILKYSGFLAAVAGNMSGRQFSVPSLLLPLGISFYVFQTAGYLIDVYRGKYRAERNLARYALFVWYFPQMVQGPINRYDRMEEQLFSGNPFAWENVQDGVLRMLYGILKKALIADPLSPVVAAVYTRWGEFPGLVSFLGAALYCLQLYCDFSGGIDVMCGASRLFGVQMEENFRQPYFSTSLADFWRRWHMSLGEWMKDYLFYPLALSKGFRRLSKLARRLLPAGAAKRITPCAATFVVFLAVGIWQGPGMANIAYGLWNGLWMSLALLLAPVTGRLRPKGRAAQTAMTAWGVLRTNLIVIIGRYFSNASSLRGALGMLRHTVTALPEAVRLETFAALGLSASLLLRLCPAVLAVLAVSAARERGVDVCRWLCGRKWYVQLAVLFAALLAAVFFVYGSDSYVPIAYVYETV